MEKLLKHGADVNLKSKLGEETRVYTPLQAASSNGHKDTVEILINNGADVDTARTDGRTSLYFAATKRHWPVVQVLLAAGAKIWDEVPGSPDAAPIAREAVVKRKRSMDAP